MESIMPQSIITSPHKQHCNNSTRHVQKWNNLEFEINSIYRHWKMSNGKWMSVFVFFLEHSRCLDFNHFLKDFLVSKSQSKHLPFHVSVNSSNRFGFARELFYTQQSVQSSREPKLSPIFLLYSLFLLASFPYDLLSLQCQMLACQNKGFGINTFYHKILFW